MTGQGVRLGDLARAFGALELAQPLDSHAGFHTLTLSFPVSRLLPDGAVHPYLEQPLHVEKRDAPQECPDTASIRDTFFFARLTVQPRNPFVSTQIQDGHFRLLAAIEAASTLPGTTKLEMVAYTDPKTSTILYRITVRTYLQAAATPAQNFELTALQWAELIKGEYQVPWIELLNHIVRRSSERAYHHVRERLISDYGEEAANSKEAAWANSWGSAATRSINELLMARLCDDVIEPTLLPGNLIITPPCGHRSMVRRAALNVLTAEGASCFSCSFCDERVLQHADDVELMFQNLVRRAHTFVEHHGAWIDIDGEIAQGGPTVILPSATAIKCALGAALASFKLPTLMSPPEISFIIMQETTIVLAEIEKSFDDGLWPASSTPSELRDGLLNLAQEALSKSMGPSAEISDATLPPGWSMNARR